MGRPDDRLMLAAACGLSAVVIAAGAAMWRHETRGVLRPRFQLKSLETGTYRASFPAHWDATDPSDPRLGGKSVTFINHRAQEGDFEPWDRPRRHMTLIDEGTSYATLDSLVEYLLRNAENPGPLESWRLANGVAARTWLERPGSTDMPFVMRWLAFQGTNGRSYSAAYPVPGERLARGRYEHLFGEILGSMEFK